MARRGLAFLAVVALLGGGCGGRKPGTGVGDNPDSSLKAMLAGAEPAFVASQPESKALWASVKRFYALGGYRPAWIVGGKARPEAEALLKAAAQVEEDGLDRADYDQQPLSAIKTKGGLFSHPAGEEVAQADVRLTLLFLRLASDLAYGRVAPQRVSKTWNVKPKSGDLVEPLRKALDGGKLVETLAALRPQHPQYQALRQALAHYRELAAQGGWPQVPAGDLKKGSRGPAVAVLRERLARTGELPAAPAGQPRPDLYDDAVLQAVKRFQARHGLEATGRVGKDTLAALNVSAPQRVRQLELNLERWRWLPEQLGERHILVNIPTFQLYAYDKGQQLLTMRVVAGKRDENPTPVFFDSMTHVVFSPHWNIPPSIAREETIPAILRDPGYIEKHQLEVVRGDHVVDPYSVDWQAAAMGASNIQIRQRPGSENALGHVKFMFPNDFNVYLHDTPADSLFGRTERDLSHGCVRVEKPEELADWVLQDRSAWPRERIQQAMYSGQERHVKLARPLPVYILYMTAWVDPGGEVQFREDMYGHDAHQLDLVSPPPPPAPHAAAPQPGRKTQESLRVHQALLPTARRG